MVEREKIMKLSLVTPVYNEEESLPLLYNAVQQALTDLMIHGRWCWLMMAAWMAA